MTSTITTAGRRSLRVRAGDRWRALAASAPEPRQFPLTLGEKRVSFSANRVMEPRKPTLDDLRIQRPDSRPPKSRLGLMVVLLLLLAGGGTGLWWKLRPKVIPVQSALVQEVSGGKAERTVLNASGYVTARREATVSSKVTGKVIEVLIEE
jgi:hypothetical protein